MQHHFPPEFLETLRSLAEALTPAALGSAVYQAYQKGLAMRDRLIQFVVGICVSYFVTGMVVAMLGWSEFAAQGLGFVIALFAFEATPKFIRGAVEVVGGLPGAIRDKYLKKGEGE
ncbi:MAG TPA: hypothetical protein VGD10_08090 [Allosphingosinicella sp.]|uniref:hypothetical protein n=1 Tax=Allosphingosinicella sp. TaxID=2823234 RepID=UPI002ED862EA